MAAIDACHVKDQEVSKYISSCGVMMQPFIYNDESNGYRLVPITDKNREQVLTGFKDKGFDYDASQVAMNKWVDEYQLIQPKEVNIIKESNYIIQEIVIKDNHDVPQSWFEYFSSIASSAWDNIVYVNGVLNEAFLELYNN